MRLYGPRAEVTLDLGGGVERLALATELIADLARVASGNGIRHFLAAGPASNADVLAALPFVEQARPDGLRSDWSLVSFPTVAAS